MRYQGERAAKLLAIFLAAAMFIESTQTACASSQADFDVDIEEEIFLEEEVSEEEAFEEESDDSADSEEIVLELPEDQAEEASNEEIEEFILTEEEIEVKEELIENDVLSDLLEMEEGTDYVENQVITLASDQEEAQKIAAAYGGELLDYSFGLATISLEDSDFTVVEAFEYGIDPDNAVPAVEPNLYLSFEEDYGEFENWSEQYNYYGNNDPLLNPLNAGYQWYHEVLGCFEAWDVTMGSSDITVAIIDSGVQTDHQDLKNAIVDNYQQVNEETYAAGLNDSNEDGYGHGTHVAGLVAASIGNSTGGAGVAPGVKILPINVCKPTNPGSPVISYMLTAIQYVAGAVDQDGSISYGERRADIINMSIGSNTYNSAMKQAIDKAYEQGVTIVAAMGNDGTNLVKYPARYAHVIGVCATRKDNTLAAFSNYGEWADISAPGAGIYSSTMGAGNSYGSKDGTSMASPIVAGACALYMSYVGHVEPDVMESVLKSSATPISQTGAGAGVVNVARMLGLDPKGVLPYYTMGLVDTLTLDKTSVTLSSAATALSDTEQLNIHDLEYKKYNGEAYGNAEHTFFEWTSSNTKVADFKGQSKGYGVTGVTITSVSPGTATITCKALDGSGKKATCKIKVVGDKAIKEVSLLCDSESSYVTEVNGKVKSVVLFNGAPSRTDESGEEEILIEDDSRYSDVTLYAYQSTKSGIVDDGIRAPVFKNSNPKVVRIDRIDSSGKVIKLTALSKGSAKITCIASDGSGKSTTIKVKVQQLVTGLEVSGSSYVAAGSKATFKANIIPSNADNKKVNWEVGEYLADNAPLNTISGITISKSGIVSVDKGVSVNTPITVRATSQEDISISDSTTFLISPKVNSVTLYNPSPNATGNWTTMAPAEIGQYKNTWTLVGAAYSKESSKGMPVSITSSNPDVIRVMKTEYDSVSGTTTAKITAFNKGKATITCRALDGSKKSKKITFKVVIPVSNISLTLKDNQSNSIAYGGKAVVCETVGKAYGTPNNSKISWDYDIIAYKQSGGSDSLKEVSPTLLKAIKKDKAFFAFSKGEIKVNTQAEFERYIQKYGYGSDGIKKYKDFGIVITASALDGSETYGMTSTIRAIQPATKIEFYKYNVTEVDGKNKYTVSKTSTTTMEIDLSDKKYNPTFVNIQNDSDLSGALKNVFALNSSNTSVASGYFGTNSSSGITGLIIYPYTVGETTFTVAPRDGSGFSRTLVVKVVDSSK